jgi:hypothetical protein
MKKSIFGIFIIGAFMIAHSAGAQSNAVKINILSPIFSTFNIAYEHAITESSSIQLGFYATAASVGDVKYNGIGITPEFRFYLSDTPAPQGFYVAPFMRYQSVKLEDENTSSEATLSTFGGGVLIGKQWIFKKRVTLDLFIGPSYSSGKVKASSGSTSDDFDVSGAFSGFGLRAGITLGVAF